MNEPEPVGPLPSIYRPCKGDLPYEEAAEYLHSIVGWVCKTCRHYWGKDEHMARYCCCANRPCGTDGCPNKTREKYHIYCENCESKRALERFEKREQRPWDGVQMVYSEETDKYYSSPEEYLDDDCEYRDDGTLPSLEDGRLILCEPNRPRHFRMADFLCDELGEDMDPPAGYKEVEDLVNAWLAKQGPLSWSPGKYRLLVASRVDSPQNPGE